VLVYAKKKDNIVAYIKTKEIILKFLNAKKTSKSVKIPLNSFHLRKIVKIYNDSIAIEALEIFEEFKTRVILVTDKEKHSSR
jgi:CBS domain containing-hemolysin-like protein